jgi:hypothetical protein
MGVLQLGGGGGAAGRKREFKPQLSEAGFETASRRQHARSTQSDSRGLRWPLGHESATRQIAPHGAGSDTGARRAPDGALVDGQDGVLRAQLDGPVREVGVAPLPLGARLRSSDVGRDGGAVKGPLVLVRRAGSPRPVAAPLPRGLRLRPPAPH